MLFSIKCLFFYYISINQQLHCVIVNFLGEFDIAGVQQEQSKTFFPLRIEYWCNKTIPNKFDSASQSMQSITILRPFAKLIV